MANSNSNSKRDITDAGESISFLMIIWLVLAVFGFLGWLGMIISRYF